MRTTIELNEALAKQVRALMAKRKTTFRALVEEGLRRVLDENRAPRNFEMRDASAGDGGLAEGVHDTSWETLSRLLYPRAS
jgi:hypothetical protein